MLAPTGGFSVANLIAKQAGRGRPITPLWSSTVFDEVAQFPQLWHAPLGFASPLFARTFSCFICGYGFSSGPSLIPDAHSTNSS